MSAIDMLPSIGIAMLGVFVSAVAQVLLKKESLVEHDRVIDEYLNARVVVAYLMMFAFTLMSVRAARHPCLSCSRYRGDELRVRDDLRRCHLQGKGESPQDRSARLDTAGDIHLRSRSRKGYGKLRLLVFRCGGG